MAEVRKVQILPKDLKDRDIYMQDGTPMWVATEDAYLVDEGTAVVCKVQHVNGAIAQRRWSVFEERTFEVLRA